MRNPPVSPHDAWIQHREPARLDQLRHYTFVHCAHGRPQTGSPRDKPAPASTARSARADRTATPPLRQPTPPRPEPNAKTSSSRLWPCFFRLQAIAAFGNRLDPAGLISQRLPSAGRCFVSRFTSSTVVSGHTSFISSDFSTIWPRLVSNAARRVGHLRLQRHRDTIARQLPFLSRSTGTARSRPWLTSARRSSGPTPSRCANPSDGQTNARVPSFAISSSVSYSPLLGCTSVPSLGLPGIFPITTLNGRPEPL